MTGIQTNKNSCGKGIENTFKSLKEELGEALYSYWNIASQILDNSGINVIPPEPEYISIERNFFSALFLYSYFRAGIPRSRRVLYATANQCLRGMVTGCDNLLDNEYKKTLDTDIPQHAVKFRSILDIMISDRILFSILHKENDAGTLTLDQVLDATYASLRTLARSGAQEASEECGYKEMLKPETILTTIHHYKTGLLFQSPWALPDIIEKSDTKDISDIKNALYQIGMGCQILDDMVDLPVDIKMKRHNYVASLIWHGANLKERGGLAGKFTAGDNEKAHHEFLFEFPDARRIAATTALNFLNNGTRMLFDEAHHFMVNASIEFISARIGADRFLFDIENEAN
ncbi:MAG: polyprenyl synthetase family protein [Proteobacteria bacterium]|nr:polyprenyl synthetase family protein [Pseudomonadota bacterium]MBU1711669.1 polyprenyl synthetase family protein [Pseudomonadota bacterium]